MEFRVPTRQPTKNPSHLFERKPITEIIPPKHEPIIPRLTSRRTITVIPKPPTQPLPEPVPEPAPEPAPEPIPEPIPEPEILNTNIEFSKQILECVALLTTTFEIKNGRLDRFIDRLLPTLVKTDIEFIFFLNKPSSVIRLRELSRFFKNVHVVSNDISDEDDVRYSNHANITYGGISGPNIHFLKSAEYCKKYNTSLFLETDCYLMETWLEDCINYVRYSGSFLVAGATYDGLLQIPRNNPVFFNHINGVAFYNTGSEYFKLLLEKTDSIIRSEVKEGKSHAYDMAMTLAIYENLDINYEFWRFILRNITKTTLIVNYSLDMDKHTSTSSILQKYPGAVIIHRKESYLSP
jgi:hypothetical protein